MRSDESGTLIICIYVDDVLCLGTQMSIEKGIQDIKKYYSIKRTSKVQEYVGCTFLQDLQNKKIFFCQPGLISRLEKEFST
jgi:hypothetical protein